MGKGGDVREKVACKYVIPKKLTLRNTAEKISRSFSEPWKACYVEKNYHAYTTSWEKMFSSVLKGQKKIVPERYHTLPLKSQIVHPLVHHDIYLNDNTCLTSVGVSLHVIGPELGPQ